MQTPTPPAARGQPALIRPVARQRQRGGRSRTCQELRHSAAGLARIRETDTDRPNATRLKFPPAEAQGQTRARRRAVRAINTLQRRPGFMPWPASFCLASRRRRSRLLCVQKQTPTGPPSARLQARRGTAELGRPMTRAGGTRRLSVRRGGLAGWGAGRLAVSGGAVTPYAGPDGPVRRWTGHGPRATSHGPHEEAHGRESEGVLERGASSELWPVWRRRARQARTRPSKWPDSRCVGLPPSARAGLAKAPRRGGAR